MAERVVNITNGRRYKFNQARRLVEDHCALAWVEYGVSVRELTVEEMVKARSKQKECEEPLYKEIHGLRFVPPASGLTASRAEGALAFECGQAIRGRFCWLADKPQAA